MAVKNLPESSFPFIETCSHRNRSSDTVVADLDGTLLCSSSSFPYFALLAFEIGGPIRLLFLLLLSPLAALLYYFISESAGIQVLIFASLAGAKLSSVESSARAVLPKFYAEDLHPETWRVFSACGRRCVLTANPTVMVAPFLKEYLGVDVVMGTELQVWFGRVTGLVRKPGVLVGVKKAEALRRVLGEDLSPEIGIGDRKTDFPFMRICKEAYLVPRKSGLKPLQRINLPKPIIFHDGRLVQKPTPLVSTLTLIWYPVGLLLSFTRIAAGSLLPIHISLPIIRALGVRIQIHGTPPPPPSPSSSGALFVCSHRTLLDPVFLSFVLRRSVPALTYSLSRLSELMSPIKTVRLTRNRAHDAATISRILRTGDLAICPEGTTCREPFLLRFSALFAELTDEIVPVAIEARGSLFYGTTARGWKGFDSFYFFMNPRPVYEVSFLSRLPAEWTCGGGGKKGCEVANYVQRMIAGRLLYECTDLTRKDKYLALAGNDGLVPEKGVRVQGGGSGAGAGGGGGVYWGAIWGKVRTRAWFYIKTGCWFGC